MSSKKKNPKQELAQVKEAQALSLEQALAHPVVQQMSKKLDEMRQLVQGLPEAIGRAVAEAQRAGARPRVLSGPPVALQPQNTNVEFHRKGRIVQDGKEIAKEGPTQGDFVKDLQALKVESHLPSLEAPVKVQKPIKDV